MEGGNRFYLRRLSRQWSRRMRADGDCRGNSFQNRQIAAMHCGRFCQLRFLLIHPGDISRQLIFRKHFKIYMQPVGRMRRQWPGQFRFPTPGKPVTAEWDTGLLAVLIMLISRTEGVRIDGHWERSALQLPFWLPVYWH